jgi:hypothetical protein
VEIEPVNDATLEIMIDPVTVKFPQGPRTVTPLLEIVIDGIVPPEGTDRASQTPPVDGNAAAQAAILSPTVAPEKVETSNTVLLVKGIGDGSASIAPAFPQTVPGGNNPVHVWAPAIWEALRDQPSRIKAKRRDLMTCTIHRLLE